MRNFLAGALQRQRIQMSFVTEQATLPCLYIIEDGKHQVMRDGSTYQVVLGGFRRTSKKPTGKDRRHNPTTKVGGLRHQLPRSGV